MDRQEEILEFAQSLLEERVAQDIAQIMEEVKKNDFVKEMLKAFDEVFQKTYALQESGEKDDIAYIMISYLRSSIVTKSYDFLIQLYDGSMYYDVTETVGTWSPKYIMNYYEKQVAYLEREAPNKIIRVQKSELLAAERELAGDYYTIVLGIIAEHINEIMELESYQKLRKLDTIEITYGGFYDTVIPLYSGAEEKNV